MYKFRIGCFLVVLLISSPLLASNVANINTDEKNNPIENDRDINRQLNDYKSVSKWIVDNQDNFKKVLDETAKKSATKWVIDASKEKPANVATQQNLSTAATNNTTTEANATNNNNPAIYHTVKRHETLYSIAKMYNITPAEIIQLNNLAASSTIFVGQKLLIKAASGNQETLPSSLAPINNNLEDNTFESGAFKYPKYKYYQVQNGDTLYSISRAVSMSSNDLIALNDLQKNRIYPGMVLKINAHYQSVEQNSANTKFNWPLIGRLLISFGPQKSGMVSEGINIMARKGATVKSVADGVVIYVGAGVKALGNLVLIQHQNGWVSVYGYLDNIAVKKGAEVKQGEIIAKVGKPNNVKIPQLHFELRQNVTAKDPLEYLNSYT